MGSNPVTIIYSEFSLHNPLARDYMNPILVQNGGIEILQFTPRGKNHAFDAYESVRENPNYLMQHLGVEQTTDNDGKPLITKSQIEDAKKRGMSDEMIRQEFYVDFDVGNIGAYFTRELADLEREGRLTTLRPNPNLPLHSVWDLGGTDATAGWLFQIEGNFIHLLCVIHDTGYGLKHYLDLAERVRQSYQCQWGNHFMPHDVKQGHQGWESTESRIQIARKHGWHFQVSPKVNFEDGIESLRFVFPKIRINKNECAIGIRAIREYQREYDEVKARFSAKPLDNWSVHIVDALRYLAVNYRRLWDVPMPASKYQTNL
jgi:phage terminase large subunit